MEATEIDMSPRGNFPGGLVALVVVFAGEAGLAMEQPEADSYEPIGLPWDWGFGGMRCQCQRFSGFGGKAEPFGIF